MFRLAHLSDIHLGPLPDVTYRELVSKRITGYVNWQRNRSRYIHDGVVDRITSDMHAKAPDHIAVSGDLVNLALDAEIDLAAEWLKSVAPADRLTVVPGNHDAYVPGALDKACRSWGAYMTGDGEPPPSGRDGFPFLRVRGSVAIIGISSARSSAPFMASGYFREKQARRLSIILDRTARQGLFRVLMIHHPPVRGAAAPHKRLFGITRFQRTIADHGAELVLHGHTHVPTLYWIAGRRAPVPVVGVCAAGQGVGGTKPPAQYNLIEIDGSSDGWSVRLQRHGLTSENGKVVHLMSQDLAVAQAHAIVQTPL